MSSQVFHNKIAELCIKHFNTLPLTGKPTTTEWTVLSCIVKEENSALEVVALGTGSKCIGKSKMCPRGTILNDSHAEIICRRAFLRYLYDQMKSESSVLIYNSTSGKFSVKSGTKFHFFTTHVPCGDAAIFSIENIEDFGSLVNENQTISIENETGNSYTCDTIIANKKRKLLHGTEDIFGTGAKRLGDDSMPIPKGEGTDCNVLGVVRTKPGRGDPTFSVSCSDKIAKWCHLGIQGALLSFCLDESIYLSTFTLAGGVPYCIAALERAFYTRLKNIEMPSEACKMQIGQGEASFLFTKSNEKQPCPSSIVWIRTRNEKPLEIAVDGRKQGVTKKDIYKSSAVLRISKLKLFQSFCFTLKKIGIKLPDDKTLESLKYIEAKSLSKNYQDRWRNLKKHFGRWTIKDPSYLQFCCE